MTKNAKGILMAVLGAGLVGGVFVVLTAVFIGIGLIAAAAGGEEENKNRNIAAPSSGSENKRKQPPSGVGSKKSNTAARGSLSPELVGTWGKSEGGGSVDHTGKSRYRSSRIYIYQFSPDGRVSYTMDRETLTIMQCDVKERKTAEGTASTEGDTLVIKLDEGTAAETNSCEGGDSVEKTSPAETRDLKWSLKTDDGADKPQLCLLEPEGEVCYTKQ